MAAKFVIKKLDSEKFMFNLKAVNGEIILTSQLYADRSGVVTGIAAVKAQALREENFEKKVASNSEHYFALKAGNGQTIGKSELYKSASSMNNGIASVMKNAAIAEVVDLR
ncbi:MAG: YegP family protein [Ignavibacteriae bacterium]|nr:YegP family protein [Ignavibacteriota bacterium]